MTSRYFLLPLLLCAACYCHAGAFEEGGAAYRAGDYELAAKKFMEVADKNDHRAMYALGSMYAVGKGVPLDYRKAFELFTRAARYGRADARYKLGILYQEGLGVARNDRRAARSFHDAAVRGYGPAQFRLGLCYAQGRGVTRDLVQAGAWLTAADVRLREQPLISADPPRQAQAESKTDADADAMGPVDAGIVKQELQKVLAQLSAEQRQSAAQLAREYLH